MSKELEMVRAMINGANEYEKKTGDKNPPVYFSKNNLLIIEKALQRLEEIDNANPSEALECLEKIIDNLDDYADFEIKQEANEYIDIIKQALIKAEKEHNSVNLLMQELDCKDFAELRKYARCGYEKLNKKYLKWEDLEFNIEKQMMAVLLNGTKYTLIVGRNTHIDKLAFLRNGEINYYFLEADKHFFNDLRLERGARMKKKIGELTVFEIDKICKTTSCEKCPFNKKSLIYSSLDTCYDIADLQRYKDQEIEVEE